MKSIILDIDHTISNAFWRDHLMGIPGEPESWDKYHEMSWKDEPIIDMIEIVRNLSTQFFIIAITTRPEKWRKLTMEWLLKHDVPIDELRMRPEGDYRKAPELKIALAKEIFESNLKGEVIIAFDDREDVIAAFKAEGITTLQVFARRTND